jgi:hypothetical protein
MKTSSPPLDPPGRRDRRLRSSEFVFAPCWLLLALLAVGLLGLTPHAFAQTAPSVLIIEAVADADNTTVLDDDGDTPSYVVLEVSPATNFTLGNWSLTDDIEFPRKWIFPATAVIPAQPGKLTVFTSGKNRTKLPYATNFTLDCGETVRLYNDKGDQISTKLVTSAACRDCVSLIQKGTNVRYTGPRFHRRWSMEPWGELPGLRWRSDQ